MLLKDFLLRFSNNALKATVNVLQFTITLSEDLLNDFFLAQLVELEEACSRTPTGLPGDRFGPDILHMMLDVPPGTHILRFLLYP